MESFNCIDALKALGEESRLRILRILLDGEHSVNDLADKISVNQYNVSKHLRVLRAAGLVDVAKNGQQRLYGLAAGFRTQLKKNNNILDLGCCQFNFDRIPID